MLPDDAAKTGWRDFCTPQVSLCLVCVSSTRCSASPALTRAGRPRPLAWEEKRYSGGLNESCKRPREIAAILIYSRPLPLVIELPVRSGAQSALPVNL
jgi:hypothetical protein